MVGKGGSCEDCLGLVDDDVGAYGRDDSCGDGLDKALSSELKKSSELSKCC